MKTIAIVIGENNEELSRKVQAKLKEAGFVLCIEAPGFYDSKRVLTLFNGVINYNIEICPDKGYTYLWPSYVLSHAADLDGAVAPDPLRGKTMEQWLANEERVVWKNMPESVREEFEARLDGGVKAEYCHGFGSNWFAVNYPTRDFNGNVYRLVTPKPHEIAPETVTPEPQKVTIELTFPELCDISWTVSK